MTVIDYKTIKVEIESRGVTIVTLSRPEVHNAINEVMIDELRDLIHCVKEDAKVRCLVLTGEGGSFCAGGDIRWFSSNIDKNREQRIEGSSELAFMLNELDNLPKPVIGKINGSAYGGGVGMISVCDITVGVEHTKFGLTEVRLGLLPANISPYVVRRMGVKNSRRTFLSGALFDAGKALSYGLLDEVVAADRLDEAVEHEISQLLQAAPGAVSDTKKLIQYVSSHSGADNMIYTSDRLADAWEKEEGKIGVQSFLNKELPPWRKGQE